jgi:DNA-binding response OmpR family regulator
VSGLVLADMSGLELCRLVRAWRGASALPFLVLSPRDDEIYRVLSLEAGADDFLAQPLDPRELRVRVAARMEAASRLNRLGRASSPGVQAGAPPDGRPSRFRTGSLEADFAAYRVTVAGRSVELTATEMGLLECLLRAGGDLCRRPRLLEEVWSYDPGRRSRTVDTHIKRLRAKLGSAGALIRTIRGVGYRLSREPAPNDDDVFAEP